MVRVHPNQSKWLWQVEELAQLGGNGHGKKRARDAVEIEGLDFLPREPREVVWRLVTSIKLPTSSRRQLHEETLALFKRSSVLVHLPH